MSQLEILGSICREGWCNKCQEWIILVYDKDSLPLHVDKKTSKECLNSRYSYDNIKYHILTPNEAAEVAMNIRDDKGDCLHSGGKVHSLACGDGDYCNNVRRLLAQALAQYFLEQKK